MKRFVLFCAVMVFALATYAQTPNRILVVDKTRAYKGFAINQLDSIVFESVVGEVKANLEFLGYEKNTEGKDIVKCSITRTPECYTFKITCQPKSIIDAYTSDISLMNFVDRTTGQTYYQDFTNAEMTGFDFEMQANTSYSLVTVAYDRYGVACSTSRADFTTPAAEIIGNPTVVWEVLETTQTSFKMKFTPNSDCVEYYTCQFNAGDAENQFNKFSSMFGFANMGDMIKQFSGKSYATIHEQEWTKLVPATDYEVYILPIDENGEYGEMVIASVTTAAQGGHGVAEVEITIGDFGGDATNGYWQMVTYTPNDQVSFFRDMIIEKQAYEAEGGDSYVLEYLKNDENHQGPYGNLYSTDVAQWNATPNTEYIAFAMGQNIDGEWGTLARKEFKTPASAGAPVKANVIGKRMNKPAKTVGTVPSVEKKGVKLVQR